MLYSLQTHNNCSSESVSLPSVKLCSSWPFDWWLFWGGLIVVVSFLINYRQSLDHHPEKCEHWQTGYRAERTVSYWVHTVLLPFWSVLLNIFSILRFFSSIKWFRDDSHPLHPLTAHKHTFTLFHRREESPWAKPHTHTPAPRSCSPGRSAKALRVCVYYYSKVFNLTFFLSLSVFLSHTRSQSTPALPHVIRNTIFMCSLRTHPGDRPGIPKIP